MTGKQPRKLPLSFQVSIDKGSCVHTSCKMLDMAKEGASKRRVDNSLYASGYGGIRVDTEEYSTYSRIHIFAQNM